MSEAMTTTDHAEIRTWAEKRDGHPAMVKTGETGGILRIDFGEPEPRLVPVSWEEFFRVFDESGLAFLSQETTEDGATSRFNTFVERDSS